ncbi:hypothetical protein JCM8208_002887 [Rhodotorula glutinis]
MAAPATSDRIQASYSQQQQQPQPQTRHDPPPPPLPPRTNAAPAPPAPASWFSPSSSRPTSSYGLPPAPPPRPPPALEPFVNPAYPVLRTLPPRTSSHRDFRASAGPLGSAFEQRQAPSSTALTSADRRTAVVSSPSSSSPLPPPPPHPQARASAFALSGGGAGPVTPRATPHDRDSDSTPRSSRDAPAADATPRPWATSSTSSAFGAHTPPMLLPRQVSSSQSQHPPSSRTWLDVDTAAAAAASLDLDQDDRRSAASSSSSSRHAPFSIHSSEDDDNAWAGTLLPSGSSPIQSPLLLADGPAEPRFPLSAVAAAGPTDRPMSEFDWAAAYADSRSPSLLQDVSGGGGPSPFPSPGEGPGAALGGAPLASPPLPPLPVEAVREQEKAGRSGEEEGRRGAREGGRAEEERARAVMDVGVAKEPPAPPSSLSPSHALPILSTSIPSSSFSTPSVSPSSPPRAPLSKATSHPDLASATLLVPAGGASSSSSSSALDRPSSRTSLRSATSATSGGRRSPGPQPPRPARRQASALSLRSTTSSVGGGAADGVSFGATAAALVAGVLAVVPLAAAEQGVATAVQAEGGEPAAAGSSTSTAPSAAALAAALPAAATSAPVVPLALSSPRLRTARSPAPTVPEKSARRMSRRLSVLGGSPGPGSPVAPSASGEGTASARASPRVEQEAGAQAGDPANRFSVPYSISDLALAYGRDSWAEYSVASESDYPPSTRSPAAPHAPTLSHVDGDGQGEVGSGTSSHLREPASVVEGSDPQQALNGERADLRVDVAVVPSSLRPHQGGAGSPSTPTRGDAKARAAAFLADLRRAKAAAAADEADEASLAVLAAPAAAVSAAERLVSSSSPLPGEVKSFLDSTSPALPPLPPASPLVRPELPSAPSLVEPPAPAEIGELEPPSPEGSPPVPPPNDSKRPSVASAATTLSIRRRSSANAPSLAPPAASAAAAAPRPVDNSPLLRRRPLPPAVQIVAELRRARTARERGRIYAEKINELGRERSRLDEWVRAMREGGGASGRAPPAASPNPSTSRRASRQDASTATFAPRADGYRAKELPSSSFSPRDMAPTNAPYPGVLNYNGGGNVGATSSTSSLRSGAPPSSFSSGSKASFFSGLGVVGRGSLGRRASKREHHGHHPAGPGAAMNISAPVQLLSSTNLALTSPTSASVMPLGGARSISGPRMPNASSSTERASLDARYSPSGSPALPSGAPPPLPVRTSFSYGSSASLGIGGGLGGLAASASVPAHLSGGMGVGSEVAYGAVDEEREDAKLVRLQDILPQASREDLVDALATAGGDDVLAISVYLSGRQGQV